MNFLISSLHFYPVTVTVKALTSTKSLVCLNRIFCSLTCAHCPAVGHLNSCPLLPRFPIFTHTYEIPRSLTFCRPSSPSSLSLFSYQRGSSPFTTFMALCWTQSSTYMSSLYAWSPELDTVLQGWPHLTFSAKLFCRGLISPAN